MLLQVRIVKCNYLDKFTLSERHEKLWIENKKGNPQLVKLGTESKFLAESVLQNSSYTVRHQTAKQFFSTH